MPDEPPAARPESGAQRHLDAVELSIAGPRDLGRWLDAVRSFRADFAQLPDVVWVDDALHNADLDLLLQRRKRLLSLVDAVSFVTMRRTRLDEAFAFEPDFEPEGFTLVA